MMSVGLCLNDIKSYHSLDYYNTDWCKYFKCEITIVSNVKVSIKKSLLW